MFVHLVKDFLKKIEEVEKRLEVSMDRDEVQTLGLKLRFFHSEIKHYKKMLEEVKDRISSVQEKYGFQPEDDSGAVKAASPEGMHSERPASKPGKEEDVVSLVSSWITKLEKEGIDPRQVLKSAEATEQGGKGKETGQSDIKKAVSAAAARAVTDMYRRSSAKKDDEQEESVTGIDARGEDFQADGPEEPDILQIEEEPEYSVEHEASGEETEYGEETGPVEMIEDEIPEEYDQEPVLPEKEDISVSDFDETDVMEIEEIPPVGNEFYEEPAPDEAEIKHSAADSLEDNLARWASMVVESASAQIDSLEQMDTFCGNEHAKTVAWLEHMIAGAAPEIFSESRNGALEFCAGYLAAKAGKPGTAINWLEASLDKGLKIGNSVVLLAELLMERKLFRKALDCFREAEEVAGAGARTGRGIARCLFELNMNEELLSELGRRSFGGGATEFEMNCLRAEALLELGRGAEAGSFLDGLIGSEGPGAWKGKYALIRGEALEKAGDVMGAVDMYEKSLELDNSNPETLYSIGRIYLQHNAVPLAKKHLLTLARRFPENPWADKARDILYREGLL